MTMPRAPNSHADPGATGAQPTKASPEKAARRRSRSPSPPRERVRIKTCGEVRRRPLENPRKKKEAKQGKEEKAQAPSQLTSQQQRDADVADVDFYVDAPASSKDDAAPNMRARGPTPAEWEAVQTAKASCYSMRVQHAAAAAARHRQWLEGGAAGAQPTPQDHQRDLADAASGASVAQQNASGAQPTQTETATGSTGETATCHTETCLPGSTEAPAGTGVTQGLTETSETATSTETSLPGETATGEAATGSTETGLTGTGEAGLPGMTETSETGFAQTGMAETGESTACPPSSAVDETEANPPTEEELEEFRRGDSRSGNRTSHDAGRNGKCKQASERTYVRKWFACAVDFASHPVAVWRYPACAATIVPLRSAAAPSFFPTIGSLSA